MSQSGSLLEQVGQTIREHGLLPPRGRVVIGVSGGLDSMVLLHLLHGLAPEFHLRLTVAHLNHGLRGQESDGDEAFVRAAAKRLGLECVVTRRAVGAYAARQRLSVEMAARVLRHDFLAQAAWRHDADTVALAHHADDQVETFMLRLLRGASLQGLGGMRWRGPSPARRGIWLVRPLLGVTRRAIAEHAAALSIAYREDSSNQAVDALRNRVRHELLPLLRAEYQPAIDAAILHLTELARAEADFVETAARVWRPAPGPPAFAALHPALQRRLLHDQLLDRGLRPNFDLIEHLRAQPENRIMVEPGLTVWRDARGQVRTGRLPAAKFMLAQLTVPLAAVAGTAMFGGLDMAWEVHDATAEPVLHPRPAAAQAGRRTGDERFDADQIGSVIILRHWRPGDRFRPTGFSQAAKLQNLFTNAKVPSTRRREVVLATTATNAIFWVEGLRIGERFKLTAGTRRELVWRWRGRGSRSGVSARGAVRAPGPRGPRNRAASGSSRSKGASGRVETGARRSRG